MSETNKPKAKYRDGNLTVTRWDKEMKNDDGSSYIIKNFQVERNYKEGEEWKSTNTFQKQDLPKLAMLLQQAYQEANKE